MLTQRSRLFARAGAGYPKQWPVTVRQLMGDVAGVHRIRGDNNDAMPGQHCASLGEAISLVVNEPLLFEPGTQHRYSVWGWVLASAVVEGAAGEPFDRVVSRDVFERLGMTRTVVAEMPGLDIATPFYSTTTIVPNPFDDDDPAGRVDYSCLAGAGAFVSTPTDLARFGSAMSKPGVLKAQTLASHPHGESPRQSARRHCGAAAPSGSRLGSGRDAQRAVCRPRRSVCPAGGRSVRVTRNASAPLRRGYASALPYNASRRAHAFSAAGSL